MSFTVYRSSAGSGKTFTLVREYLKIVLQDPSAYRHILAITFTNKAAAEMKERVLQSLRLLSQLPDAPDKMITQHMLPRLVSETGLSETEISDRASQALKLILHNYSDFAIGTIDSFSHRIIRSFAHDFGLPVQFTVELDATELLTTAVDMLLDRVGEEEELTRFLVKFLEFRMDEDRGWNIDRILVEFARVLTDEEGQENITELRSLTLSDFTRISEGIQNRIRSFEKLVCKKGSEALELIRKSGLTSEAFYQGNKGIWKYFEFLASGRVDKLQPNSFVLKTISEDKWEGGKASPAEIAQLESIKPGLIQYYRELETLMERDQENYMLNKLLAKTIFPLAVLNEIDRVLSEFKKQNNLVHISEFNRRISSIVMKEPVPFIYERLGERYHHLMIDEFQDTSRLQWQNFVPLVENALSAGYFNLVVGDGKQAIYRWRNGDVTQFAQLPALQGAGVNPLIRQRQQVLENHYQEAFLNRNFRSKHEIVTFNNGFFRFLENVLDEPEKMVYRGLEQEADPEKTGGYIRIQFFSDKAGDISFEEWNFRELIRVLQEVLQDGYAPGDIAVLCRKNSQASIIARKLMEEGIDVISSESILLVQSPEVNFLVSLIRLLFEQENQINQAEIAGFLLQSGRLPGMDWPGVLKYIYSPGLQEEGLISLMNQHDLAFVKDELLALPVYDLCETLIRNFSLNRQANPYLQFFLDAVLVFMTRDLHGVSDFIGWWDEKKESLSVVVPEGIDAVRIMSIHKSKGLQFPVVIFPFATESKRLTKEYLWADLRDQHMSGLKTALLKTESSMEKTPFRKQYLEEEQKSMLDLVNLLYVVMTRPEDRLYILTSLPPEKTERISSLPAFFTGYLRKEGLWRDEITEYETGQRKPELKRSQHRTGEAIMLGSFISADWRKKIRIRRRAPETWDMENPLGKTHYGNLVHTLLSGIKTFSDTEPVLKEALSEGLIAAEDLGLLREMIQGVLNHPELKLLFTDRSSVKTEPEILLPDGKVYRPDRVVFMDGITVVVEYKTGKKDEKHAIQLETYGKLLKGMGFGEVKKILVYLHEKTEVVILQDGAKR